MSNTFRQTIQSLNAEVLSKRHVPAFDRARGRHDALAAHHTITSVLGTLGDERRDGYAERDALTRALIAEQQWSPSSFWSAALLLAYYPMLSRLRHRIYGDAIPAGDLDQIVITMFLTVVTEFPLDKKRDRTAMHLRQRTERRVFRLVREDQRRQEFMRPADPVELEWLDEPEWPELPGDGHRAPRNAKDAAAAVALLVEHAADVLDGEAFDLMAKLQGDPQIHLDGPVGYVEMLRLQASARLWMLSTTDSRFGQTSGLGPFFSHLSGTRHRAPFLSPDVTR